MSGIFICSDYTDYYDVLHDNKSDIKYVRKMSNSMQRGKALKYLRELGIKTIETKSVRDAFPYYDKLVVYTDPKGHNGKGKKIMKSDKAIREYENYLCSPFYETDGTTIKYLQIGDKRITLQYYKDDTESLEQGTIIDISQSTPEYNMLIGLPIFSIDYININGIMTATDFNEVENLSKIGIDKYFNASEIIDIIQKSLIKYNKA